MAKVAIAILILAATLQGEAEKWEGLWVVPKNSVTCPQYDGTVYGAYSSERLRPQLLLYLPYQNRVPKTRNNLQVEHVVARKEAHVSGLCKETDVQKRLFVKDIRNMVLATGRVNRLKSFKDAAEWMPTGDGAVNKIWFARKVIEVKRAWNLAVDPAECNALAKVLSLEGCPPIP